MQSTDPRMYKTRQQSGFPYFPSFQLQRPHLALRPSLFTMKFTTVFAIIATVVTAVSATLPPTLTNAKRLARGLPLLPPVRRGTPTYRM